MHAVALAGLAAAALDVEAEAPGIVAARARLGHRREQLAQRREQSGVGRRVGARRAPDRALIDVDDAIDSLESLDALAGTGASRRAPFSCAAAWPKSVSTMSVDLPEPDTPVTQVNSAERQRDRDVAQVVAVRAEDRISRARRCAVRSRAGSAMRSRPARYARSSRPGSASISAGVPCATRWPPCAPAPGPRSTTWSASRIASSSCSTTITVLPRSRSCLSVAEQALGCRADAARSRAHRGCT